MDVEALTHFASSCGEEENVCEKARGIDQHKLHARIAALQGRNGIYLAGAHVV